MFTWFPQPSVRVVAAGPAEPCSSQERCWADEPGGQQCAEVIDIEDLLGLCERHLAALREEGDPPLDGWGTDVA